MSNDDKFVYKLSKPIDIAIGGKGEECYDIEFKAPYYKCFEHASKIEQDLSYGLNSLMPKSDEVRREEIEDIENKEELTFEQKKMLIERALMVKEIDFSQTVNNFVKLCSFVGNINKISLEKKHFNKISYKDIKDMLFEYIVNFLMPSYFQGG